MTKKNIKYVIIININIKNFQNMEEKRIVYPPKTAGRLMTIKIPKIKNNITISDIEKFLVKETKNLETINYIYIIDSNEKLKGVVSIKEIFRSPKNTPVKNIMSRDVIMVKSYTDQEKAALLALKYNLKALPVVDKNGKLLGVVPSDQILRILNQESIENILRFGGVVTNQKSDDIFKLSIFQSLKHRIPWLIIGLFGSLVIAKIISGFEETMANNIILASFIPLVVYLASAVSTQMTAFVIRDFALNQKNNFNKYFFRQSSIVLLIGIILSFIFFIFSLLLYNQTKISLVISISLFITILSSVLTGLIIPFLFGKMKLDPANASGPMATIAQDTLSIVIYFSFASLLF